MLVLAESHVVTYTCMTSSRFLINGLVNANTICGQVAECPPTNPRMIKLHERHFQSQLSTVPASSTSFLQGMQNPVNKLQALNSSCCLTARICFTSRSILPLHEACGTFPVSANMVFITLDFPSEVMFLVSRFPFSPLRHQITASTAEVKARQTPTVYNCLFVVSTNWELSIGIVHMQASVCLH